MRPGAPLASLALALFPACASQSVETEWERVETPHFVAADGAFALELPLGWMRSGQVLARDPTGNHAISFNAGPVLTGDEALAVEASAPELVQALGDQLAAQPGVVVLACRAVTLDGLPGFRAHFRQSPPPDEASAAPLSSEHLLYSAIDGEMLFAFALEAPAGAEFARDLPEFEALVASFRRLTTVP
ncbi:MAG: hypothetical protein HOP15_04165 [Planctomycetes bacterium]|nr:hypothetical protein [Planctomycetota bacterium]